MLSLGKVRDRKPEHMPSMVSCGSRRKQSGISLRAAESVPSVPMSLTQGPFERTNKSALSVRVSTEERGKSTPHRRDTHFVTVNF